MRRLIETCCQESECVVRMAKVLSLLGISRSSWYSKPKGGRRGRVPVAIDPALRSAVVACAERYPWWGYKRIAVVCRRNGLRVSNKVVYRVMRDADLLQRRRVRQAELYQTARLFELLPSGPNRLWQTDITWVHVPGFGYWYAVTVIDYYSRYLLACHLSGSHTAGDVQQALDLACEEAERVCGSLRRRPVLVSDNGPSFVSRSFQVYVKGRFDHVRIAYRTPTQLGLLERFHQTLKTEEVYWRLYENPSDARRCLEEFRTRYNQARPHWALRPFGGGDVLVPSDVYVDGLAVEIPVWQGWAKAAKEKLGQMVEGDHFPPFGPVSPMDKVA